MEPSLRSLRRMYSRLEIFPPRVFNGFEIVSLRFVRSSVESITVRCYGGVADHEEDLRVCWKERVAHVYVYELGFALVYMEAVCYFVSINLKPFSCPGRLR